VASHRQCPFEWNELVPKLPSLQPARHAVPVGRPDALFQRALLAHREGKLDEAARLLERTLAIDPLHTQAISELAVVQFKSGGQAEGLRQFETLLRIDPENPTGWKNYGIALLQVGGFEEALVCFENTIKLRTVDAETGLLYANTLFYLGRFRDAAAAYEPLINFDLRAAVGLGLALQWCGQYDEALSAFDRVIELQRGLALATYDKAVLLILLGDLPTGLRLHERRWDLLKGEFQPKSTQPLWLGETGVEGKVLYVHREQGLGDTLQFCRYATLAARAGAQVILEVESTLVRLISTLQGVGRVIAENDPVPHHDLRCPIMSLPLAFGTTVKTIPAEIPYLHADPAAAATWRDRLQEIKGKRVGLIWAGSSRIGLGAGIVAADKRRSVALAKLAPVTAVSGCAFFSLQLGPPAEQATYAPACMVLHDYTRELDDFADTAALVENLDLVISVDTSTAHLAGAMGKPVWLLNRFDTCWRWFLDREDSPWYPTMRIFRQPQSGDWDSVIRSVTAALREFAGA
jgi:tetratricopeptide (TPR) repeat protein